MSDEGHLITPRRNFLVRALGFTAAGAAVTVPIVTLADARERPRHHAKGLEQAFRDAYPGVEIRVEHRLRAPEAVIGPDKMTALFLAMAGTWSD